MADSSSGDFGAGPPLPPKRPTIIRPLPTNKQNSNGIENKPVPVRPVPPVSASRPPIPEHGTKRTHDGGPPPIIDKSLKPGVKPQLVSTATVKKKPEITILAARPMSEVGFRSENSPPVTSPSPNIAFDDEAPPLPKRESSLEPEPSRPNPPAPNKPLPPAPPSRPKFPLRPSQPPKPKTKSHQEPEVGLLIDLSDDIPTPLQPSFVPTPVPSPTVPSLHSPPSVPGSSNIAGNSSVPLILPLVLRSPPPVPNSPKATDDCPVPVVPPPPKSPHPVPAIRSKSPAPSASNQPSVPHNISVLPKKPNAPTIKPRSTPDNELIPEYFKKDEQEVPEIPRPKRPTIIRPKKSQEPPPEVQDKSPVIDPPLLKPKPSTPTAAGRTFIEDQEPPEYAVIMRPKCKPVIPSQKIEDPSPADVDPPLVPPKLYNPIPSSKPTVLPKPRTSLLISPQSETPSEESANSEVKKDKIKSGMKPTIIRPPPKPLRLHEVEENNKQSSVHDTSESDSVSVRNITSMFDKPQKKSPDAPPAPGAPPRPASRIHAAVGVEEAQKSKPPKPRPLTIAHPLTESYEAHDKKSAIDSEPSFMSTDDVPEKRVEKAPTRPNPPSPKNRTPPNISNPESTVKRTSSKSGGPPPRPVSAAPTLAVTKDREKPFRPQPPRPGPPKMIEKPPGSPALPPRPTPSHQLYHYILTHPHGTAQHDYSASNEGEISFKEGEIIILTGRVDSQWLKGKVGKTEGVFPETFIEVIHPLHSDYPGPQGAPDSASVQAWSSPDWGDDTVEGVKLDTGTGPRCRARFDFEGEGHGDLDFEENDIIKLLKHVGSDWLQGELNNKVGMFPLSFVEIIEDVHVGCDSDESNKLHIVNTVFDFDGLEGELSFQAGEMVDVISEVSSEWLYGEIDGRIGKFPATFVDHVPANLPKYQQHSSPDKIKQDFVAETTQSSSVLFICTAAFDYESEQSEDLCFTTGDRIEVLKDNGDWLMGRLHNLEGIFPKSFIKLDSLTAEESSTSLNQKLAKALFDFEGEGDKELTFRKDDVIKLGKIVAGASDWQWGNLDDKYGMFPVDYIEVL